MAKTLSTSKLERIGNLFKSHYNRKIEGLIVDCPIDLYYLTGMMLSLGRLVVKKGKAKLFVDGRYLQMCREKSPIPVAAKEEFTAFTKGLKKIGFDSSFTTVEQGQQLEKLFPKKLVPIPGLLKEERLIKDPEEIAKLEKSARLLWRGFQHIRKQLVVGIKECELAAEFEIFCLKNGASRLGFEPIIAFGENSAMPHYHPGNRKLQKGDFVLIDIGVVIDNYHSDMTRTEEFGEVDKRLLHMKRVVLDAHAAALKICRPGIKIKELDLAARKVMRRAKMEALFVHGLGHGVGLEIHEPPVIRYDSKDKELVLKAGMVITIEPGLYLPKVGGVRHEDTIVITEKGYHNFYG